MKLIGHTWQKNFLSQMVDALNADRATHHAFLLSGVDAIGKKRMALSCARALLDGTAITWDVDAPTTGIYVIEPEKEETTRGVRIKDISVAQVRQLRSHIALTSSDRAHVIIVDDADRMSNAAENALLKVLEEPRTKTYFFLITSQRAHISETVQSRCIHVGFAPLSSHAFESGGVGGVDVYIKALGRPGNLEENISSEKSALLTQALTSLSELRTMHTYERLMLAQKLSEDADHASLALAVWAHKIHHVAHTGKHYRFFALCEKIEHARQDLQKSQTNKRLVLENLVLSL